MSLSMLTDQELARWAAQKAQSEISARIAHLTATIQVLEVEEEYRRRGLEPGDLDETQRDLGRVRRLLEIAHATRQQLRGGGEA